MAVPLGVRVRAQVALLFEGHRTRREVPKGLAPPEQVGRQFGLQRAPSSHYCCLIRMPIVPISTIPGSRGRTEP